MELRDHNYSHSNKILGEHLCPIEQGDSNGSCLTDKPTTRDVCAEFTPETTVQVLNQLADQSHMNKMALRDHNYCQSNKILDEHLCPIEQGDSNGSCLTDIPTTRDACAELTTETTVQVENQLADQSDMDIIQTGPIKLLMPVLFLPLSVEQRNTICAKLGFTLDATLTATHLEYAGVGHQCTDAPLTDVEVEGDGNCLFRAFSYLLIGSGVKHEIIRSHVCDYIEDNTNWEKLHSYIREYDSGKAYIAARNMKDLATWGTAVELIAFAQLTGKDVLVYTVDRWLRYCCSGTMQQRTNNAFYLNNSSGMHYDPVLKVPTGMSTPVQPNLSPTMTPKAKLACSTSVPILAQGKTHNKTPSHKRNFSEIEYVDSSHEIKDTGSSEHPARKKAKIDNVQKQKQYMENLKTPEKHAQLSSYKMKKAEWNRDLQHRKKCSDIVQEHEKERNREKQRRFMNKLRTPEKKQEFQDHKEKKNARRKALYNRAKQQNPVSNTTQEYEQQCNEERPRFMEKLKTDERNDKYLALKEKRNARQRALRQAKKAEPKKYIARHGLDSFLETSVKVQDLGGMKYTCSECKALMFKGEKSDRAPSKSDQSAKFSLCCSYGAVCVPPVKDPPELLQHLLTGGTKRDREFRRNIRAYNSSLAFAAMCLTQKEYKFNTQGPYCFRISGQIYHSLSQMLPELNAKPKYSQIYIYDQQNELSNRLEAFQQLDKAVLQELQDMIKEVNPYAHVYYQAGTIMNENPSLDIKLVLRADNSNVNVDPRRYNLPTGMDVAVILPEDRYNTSERDVIVYKNATCHPHGRFLEKIKATHPMYDPLMYVLMFPFGDLGWQLDYKSGQKRCTAMEYYKYRLMLRAGDTFNTIQRMGRLFQQYVVDIYVKIEEGRLRFLRNNQSKIRAEVYQGLADAVQNSDGNVDGSQIGKKVILPSTFTGSARYQHQLYQDAMAIVRHYGKPDLFITFTCNPRWKEITDELLENQQPEDRPDLMTRVFKLKLQSLLHDLSSTNVLGRLIAIIHVIEWQKRGPPHAHILGICEEGSKPRTSEDYDAIVCAEIPNQEQFPDLYKTVTMQMIHGPCGSSNPDSPCMVDGKCSKHYPKSFEDSTYAGSDGYPHYMRRNDGKFVVKKGVRLDNRNVVPYNAYLSKRYSAHINVEICSSIQSCKYLYKYVYKGPDMAYVAVQSESDNCPKAKDEIDRYVNSRFVTASEACWRIFGFDVHGRDPTVQRLAVHEENLQTVRFNEEDPEEAVGNPKNTTLLGWFKLNQVDPDARQWKYHEVPEHYVWNTRQHKWTKRKQGRCVGRMYTTTPAQGERHYLRLLLHHISGATSYADLKKSPDGILHKTYKEAAMKLGLLESDDEWNQCLAEAAVSFMPKQLRHLFVTILVYGEPAKPLILWQTYKDVLGEDITRESSQVQEIKDIVDNEVLLLLQEELEGMGRSLEEFGLPTPNTTDRIQRIPKVIEEEIYDSDTQRTTAAESCKCFNSDQEKAFSVVMQAVNDDKQLQRLFFLNAAGGYGKTFLIKALLSTVRGMGKIALAVASSGIAAELLEGGRTAHSRFKIPIPVSEESVCNISLQSNDAKLIKKHHSSFGMKS